MSLFQDNQTLKSKIVAVFCDRFIAASICLFQSISFMTSKKK